MTTVSSAFDFYFDLSECPDGYNRLVWFPGEKYASLREDEAFSYFFSSISGETVLDAINRMRDSLIQTIGEAGLEDAIRRASE